MPTPTECMALENLHPMTSLYWWLWDLLEGSCGVVQLYQSAGFVNRTTAIITTCCIHSPHRQRTVSPPPEREYGLRRGNSAHVNWTSNAFPHRRNTGQRLVSIFTHTRVLSRQVSVRCSPPHANLRRGLSKFKVKPPNWTQRKSLLAQQQPQAIPPGNKERRRSPGFTIKAHLIRGSPG